MPQLKQSLKLRIIEVDIMVKIIGKVNLVKQLIFKVKLKN
jgi:hypothetical protein